MLRIIIVRAHTKTVRSIRKIANKSYDFKLSVYAFMRWLLLLQTALALSLCGAKSSSMKISNSIFNCTSGFSTAKLQVALMLALVDKPENE